MKKNHFMLTITLIAGISFSASAQVSGLPNPSSTQTIIQEFGLGKVSITYSRPNVKGRQIFGGLVPYGQVWRAGANTATSIDFSENVTVEGNAVPAGEYSLFCIPEKDEWTIILNKATKQWGAYTYDQKNDLLRFKVKPASSKEKLESFTIQFANSTSQSVDLQLVWDHIHTTIHLKTDDDAKIMANIDQLMEGGEISNLIYFNTIQYYYEHNKDIDKALDWIEQAQKAYSWNSAFWLFKSRFLLRKGDKAGAITAAEDGIKVAASKNSAEYVSLNQKAIEQARK